MLEEMSNSLIKEYKEKEKQLKSTSEVKSYAKSATTEALLPSLDAEYMAKQVVGRYHWNNAKPKDKAEFIDAYKNALAAGTPAFSSKPVKRKLPKVLSITSQFINTNRCFSNHRRQKEEEHHRLLHLCR